MILTRSCVRIECNLVIQKYFLLNRHCVSGVALLVSNSSIQIDIMTIVIVEIDHLVATEIVAGAKAERTWLGHCFTSQKPWRSFLASSVSQSGIRSQSDPR